MKGGLEMGYDEGAADRVRRAMAGRKDVVEKRMVGGGLSFLVNGNLCCGVSRSALMVRVGPEAYEAALARPHVRPLEFAGRAPVGYVYVDLEGWRTEKAFATWVRRGLDFVLTLPAKEPAVSKPRSKAGAKKAAS